MSNKNQKRRHGTGCAKRWAERKREEAISRLDRKADDLNEFKGNRTKQFLQECHLHKAKAAKYWAERKILETTSLGDLIK